MWKTVVLDHLIEVVQISLKDPLDIHLAQGLHAEELTLDDSFYDLQDEWDQLLEVSEQPAFFLRCSWNRIWWENYAPPGSHLMLITCRDEEGRLVGLAPFYRRHLRTAGIPHIREVLFVGTGVFTETSHFLDIIARRGFERLVAETVADFLRRRNDWDRLWLHTIPEFSTALPYLKEAMGVEVRSEFCDRSHMVDTTVDWETFLASLGKSTRRNLIRYLRRVTDSYVCELRLVQTEDELESAMDALVRLHQARWQSRGEPGSFALHGFEQFLRGAARASLREGRLRFWTLSLDGRVVAAKIAFFDKGVVYGFQQGFDPDYAKDGLGRVVSGLCIKACIEDKRVNAFDFMGGNTQYKDSWSNSGRDTLTVTWLRRGIRARVFEAVNRTRAGVKTALRGVVPSSLKLAVHKVRQRRYYSEPE